MSHYPKIFDIVGSTEAVISGGLTFSGQNYVIVKSVNTGVPATDEITNGAALLDGLDELDALNWGGRSLENMGSLILTPGIYKLDNSQILMKPFINIVGLSSNRRDTIIISGSASAIIWGLGITAGLQNVELKASNSLSDSSVMLKGDDDSFPIVEDVYFGSDKMLFNSVLGAHGFNNLVGRWDNCEWISGVD